MPAQKRLFTKLKLWRFGLTSLLILFYLVTPTAVAADFLKITAPAEITKEESFEVNLEISAQAGTTYSVKARLGSEPNQLTKAQTFSEGKNVWLSDSVSWSSFPKFTTDNNGMWIGTIKVRTSDKVTLGQNYLVIRIRNENGSTVD